MFVKPFFHLACIHRNSLAACGPLCFCGDLLTLRGLVTYYVLFFTDLESRRLDIAGSTAHPDEPWMKQIARNVTMEGCGALRDCGYLLHDRDTKSPSHSGPSLRQVGLNRLRCLRAART